MPFLISRAGLAAVAMALIVLLMPGVVALIAYDNALATAEKVFLWAPVFAQLGISIGLMRLSDKRDTSRR